MLHNSDSNKNMLQFTDYIKWSLLTFEPFYDTFCPAKHTWGPPCHVKVTYMTIYACIMLYNLMISTPFHTTPPPKRHHGQLLRAWSIKGFWTCRPSCGGRRHHGSYGRCDGCHRCSGCCSRHHFVGWHRVTWQQVTWQGTGGPKAHLPYQELSWQGTSPTQLIHSWCLRNHFRDCLRILEGGAWYLGRWGTCTHTRWQLPSPWSTATGRLKMEDLSWFGKVRGPNIYSFKAVARPKCRWKQNLLAVYGSKVSHLHDQNNPEDLPK